MNRTLPRFLSLALPAVLLPFATLDARAQTPSHRSAIIYPFAVAGQPAPDPATLSSEACPTEPSRIYIPVPIEPKLLETISQELEARLQKSYAIPARIVAPGATPPLATASTLTFAGCIFRAQPGDEAQRLAGMREGASYLTAHVRIFAGTSIHPIHEFDVEVSGTKVLPPAGPYGLITRAAPVDDQTLPGDAKHLADEILKKFARLEKPAKTTP